MGRARQQRERMYRNYSVDDYLRTDDLGLVVLGCLKISDELEGPSLETFHELLE
jgi:hypothetical protein